MENFLLFAPTIAAQDTIYSPFPAHLALPMVACRDAADMAVRFLQDAAWTGHRTIGVRGPSTLSHADAASIIGQALRRPVHYTHIGFHQLALSLAAAGNDARVGCRVHYDDECT